MRIVIDVDTEAAFGKSLAGTLDRYFSGGINAREAADILGVDRSAWDRVMSAMISFARVRHGDLRAEAWRDRKQMEGLGKVRLRWGPPSWLALACATANLVLWLLMLLSIIRRGRP